MARIKALAEYLLKLTEFLDQEVSKGFDLNDMGQLMKFLHALQLQAQALIDMAQRAAALMGEPTQSYAEARKEVLGVYVIYDFNRHQRSRRPILSSIFLYSSLSLSTSSLSF